MAELPHGAPGAPTRPQIAGLTTGALLATGGSAEVWAATADDGTPLVIKVGTSANTLLRARVKREGTYLDRVGPPTVPRLHSTGELGPDTPFVVMERIEAPT